MIARAALAGAAAAALSLAPARASGPADGSGGPPLARPRSVLARVERAAVRLGAPFAYEIEVVHPADEAVDLGPPPAAPPFRAGAGACRREPVAAAAPEGDVRTTCTVRLALFDLGPHELPALRLLVRTPRGEEALAVEGPRVTGVGLADPAAPAETLALRPLAPPVPLLVPTWAPALRALAAAAALALALLAGRILRARARARARPPPPEPPDARLARRLDALGARGAPPREHYFELSAIVREWVGAVTGLPALELTTAELAGRLAAAVEPRVNGHALVAFLETADLVKFADDDASPERCAASLAWARRLPATAARAADRTAAAAGGRE